LKKNNMSSDINYSSSEDNDHYKKNYLQSTRSNESKAEILKKRKRTKEYANVKENVRNEIYDDLLHDNPIVKSKKFTK